jgi:hypothetical protein
MGVGRAELVHDHAGSSTHPSGLCRQDGYALGDQSRRPLLLAGVVLRVEVPLDRVDLPRQGHLVEPRVHHAEQPAPDVVHRRVPPRFRKTGPGPEPFGVQLCGGPHSRPDAVEDPAGYRRPPSLAVLDLVYQVLDGAEPALHGVGQELGDVAGVREPAHRVDGGPGDGGQGHP